MLLSCFDGIRTAALALKELVGPLAAFCSWEVDPECILVLKARHPKAFHRGDFRNDSLEDIVATLRRLDGFDDLIIFVVGAPPCPDFSVVRPDALGRAGPEGQKFTEFCDWVGAIEQLLPGHVFLFLVENVVLQDRGEIDFFSRALNCRPIMVDSSDFGIISRPRLWWIVVDKSGLEPDDFAP